MPQSHFVSEQVTKLKFEEGFGSIFSQISEMLEIAVPESIPHMNKSDSTKPVWSNELLDLFNSIYKSDFELFGYDTRKLV